MFDNVSRHQKGRHHCISSYTFSSKSAVLVDFGLKNSLCFLTVMDGPVDLPILRFSA